MPRLSLNTVSEHVHIDEDDIEAIKEDVDDLLRHYTGSGIVIEAKSE